MHIDETKLDFYIENNWNVLLVGRHGVGKTEMVKQAFERHNLNWKYFSAATMDPWVDFVGVPKEKTEGEETYIDLVRPKNFQNGSVEAIFMDELNRSKEKVRNAVMELIQFKSINGTPFPNLRFVWAAINPEEDEDEDLSYDVEMLDPAQKDRFQIILDVPYEPSKEFFVKKFGKEMGEGAVEWWYGLEPEQNRMVSPRRLEYALNVHKCNGDIRDVLPNKELNLQQLRQRISTGSIELKLQELYESGTEEECKKEFSNSNFVTDAVPLIVKNESYINKFSKFIPKDILSKMVTDNEAEHLETIVKNTEKDIIRPVLSDIVAANAVDYSILQKITECAEENSIDLTSEKAFKAAVDEGLVEVDKSQAERYNALHSINHNFNHEATYETYADCVKFFVKVIYHSSNSSLEDKKKPFYQISSHVLGKIEKCLTQDHDTNVWAIWEEIKASDYKKTDKNRIGDIEKFLKLYLGK